MKHWAVWGNLFWWLNLIYTLRRRPHGKHPSSDTVYRAKREQNHTASICRVPINNQVRQARGLQGPVPESRFSRTTLNVFNCIFFPFQTQKWGNSNFRIFIKPGPQIYMRQKKTALRPNRGISEIKPPSEAVTHPVPAAELRIRPIRPLLSQRAVRSALFPADSSFPPALPAVGS